MYTLYVKTLYGYGYSRDKSIGHSSNSDNIALDLEIFFSSENFACEMTLVKLITKQLASTSHSNAIIYFGESFQIGKENMMFFYATIRIFNKFQVVFFLSLLIFSMWFVC